MKNIVAFLLLVVCFVPLYAQDNQPSQFNQNLSKSTDIQMVDGEYFYMHKVMPKQTLYSISRLYNVPVKTICQINNISSEDNIDVDAVLKIPAPPPAQPQPEMAENISDKPVENKEGQPSNSVSKSTDIQLIDGKYYYMHKVLPKQTLYSISKLYGVSVKNICRINNISSEDNIDVDSILKIPAKDVDKEQRRAKRRKKSDEQEVVVAPEPVVNEPVIVPDDGSPKADIAYDKDIIKLKTRRDEDISAESQTNKTFNVALLIPLYYKDAATLKVDPATGKILEGSNKPFRFIQFYQGALLAIDSLVSRGMNVNLSVFDVDEKESSALPLVNNNSLKNMDLIIGPFYKNPYNVICEYAKKQGINIVNPTLTVRNTQIDHHSSFKNNVDAELRYTYIANYIIQNYNDANIIFYTTDYNKDLAAIEYISRLLTKSIPQQIELRNYEIYNFLVNNSLADTTLQEGELLDTIFIENRMFTREELLVDTMKLALLDNSVKTFDFNKRGVSGYDTYLSNYRNNVVISFAKDYSQVLDNVTRLSARTRDRKITLFGDESWTAYELDNSSLNSVNFHFCSNKMINYRSDDVKRFIEKFSKEYFSEPNKQQYAYLGFDTFYYFMNMLFYFGNDFPNYVSNIYYEGLESSFLFAPADKSYGYENFFSNIYKIEGYKYIVAPFSGCFWNNTATEMKTFINTNDR